MHSNKKYDCTIDLHRQQYGTTDFDRHKRVTHEGLGQHERFIIEEYLQPHLRVLEIGCGTGRISFGMEDELGFSSIVATDFLDTFIEEAQRMGSERDSGVRFQVAEVTSLPFEDNSFDAIVCLGVVLSHLPHRKHRIQALSECYRVLKHEGFLLLDVMNISYRKWHMRLLRLLTKVSRAIRNPHGYERNCLPRLGSAGKFDPLFLARNKPVLHYFTPGELVFDLCSRRFLVMNVITSLDDLEKQRFREHGAGITAVARKMEC